MDKVVGRIEKSMKGCLRPKRDFRLSEIEPTTGSETASINVEIARTILARRKGLEPARNITIRERLKRIPCADPARHWFLELVL